MTSEGAHKFRPRPGNLARAHVIGSGDITGGYGCRRRHLDPTDFEELADTGYLRLIVPVDHGGLWTSLAETGPVLIEAVSELARGDQSVALVASMHPAVLAFWAAESVAAEPNTTAWEAQKRWVFETAMDGHFWGTITSEPGSGGDFLRTKATATAVEGIVGRYHIYGAKHFGSGAQLVSYMITTAKPDGADLPLAFYLDLRDQPWDGTAGLSITRPWDGMGMKATQSHAVMLEGIEGIVFAWPDALEQVATVVGTLGLAMFTGVIAAIVDSAMSEAETRLSGRPLRSYEDVEWTHAQIEHWMLVQARNGLTNTVATTDPAAAALATVKAKMGDSHSGRVDPRSIEPRGRRERVLLDVTIRLLERGCPARLATCALHGRWHSTSSARPASPSIPPALTTTRDRPIEPTSSVWTLARAAPLASGNRADRCVSR